MTQVDSFQWLEEFDTRVRDWIASRNQESLEAICDAQFEADRKTIRDLLDAETRVPTLARRGSYFYNLQQNSEHPRGRWRRTGQLDFGKKAAAWEVLLDLDDLAASEKKDWTFRGFFSLPPEHRHALIQLSIGGSDAVVIREFDSLEKQIVAGGFWTPEQKGYANWLDADHLLLTSALGGESLKTASGYARTVRVWRRGTTHDSASIVFEGESSDLGVYGWRYHGPDARYTVFLRKLDFDHHHVFVQFDGAPPARLDFPKDAEFTFQPDRLILLLRSEWRVGEHCYPPGSLLTIDLNAFIAGERNFDILFLPTQKCFLQRILVNRSTIALCALDNVQSKVSFARYEQQKWYTEPREEFDPIGTVDVSCTSGEPSYWFNDDTDWFCYPNQDTGAFFITASSSIEPPKLWLASFGKRAELIMAEIGAFERSFLRITQHQATSGDAREIPYFQIAHRDLVLDASNSVLMTGYGGFNDAFLPGYDPVIGKMWLERGGVYVIANIRGGGELGPDWHRAGIREGKKAAQDDFAAVAKDLISRRVTEPRRLACKGASNGGLLVGNMLTRHPGLFGAIHCSMPLLDMRRYTKLLAGWSWVSEYGNPDNPDDWRFLREISPYHNVRSDQLYPPILLTTNGRDDRVHPAHARKMAAALMEAHQKVFYFESNEGGHAGAANHEAQALLSALSFSFLRKYIMGLPNGRD